ncbi:MULTISPECIES: glycosyltransferase family 2 protein [Clostridia]|uniref:glycosyltransferase family 2 protein n=1 Tax=Clostridia TaxID=186801 RepID=UPI000E540A0D|nr:MULTISPECIES: glycosyltransferase family 2 protein [Clostridia]RHV71021.1 glycosyltransferase [Roseburia sp. OM02-15]
MDKIAVLIPCYNEAATIRKVVTDFKTVLPDATVYVYDNNSTDGSAHEASEAGAIVRNEYNQGKGNVIRRMFRDIDAECYIMVDADDTYPAEAARAMAKRILEGHAEMIVGDRLSSTYYEENKRPFHNFGNKLVQQSINQIFKTDIADIMTGYRAFSYLFVKSFPVLSKGFEIETEMTIHAVDKNMRVECIPVTYRDRPAGSESKLNTIYDGAKVLFTICNLYETYRPLRFFGLLGGCMMATGAVFVIPVIAEFMATHLVPRFPTLIVGSFMIMAGMMSWFAGMILETIEKKNKMSYETSLVVCDYMNKMLKNSFQ